MVTSAPGVPGRGDRAGYSLAEMMAVIVVLGVVVSLAAPRIDLGRNRTDAAMAEIGTTILAAQRAAIGRQHDVVVSFDETARSYRVHFDRNGNGAVDSGEYTRIEPLGESLRFGRGSAPTFRIGTAAVSYTRRQNGNKAVTFRRNGSASEEGGFYLSTVRGNASDARLVIIDRATGRPSWFRYTGSQWTQEF